VTDPCATFFTIRRDTSRMSDDTGPTDAEHDRPSGADGGDAGGDGDDSDVEFTTDADTVVERSGSADDESETSDGGAEFDDRETELEEWEADLEEWEARLDAREAELDERAVELDNHEERLDQRETGLDTKADDLRDRADRLDDRESDLEEWQSDIEAKRDELAERESAIQQRESELDERQAAIEDREAELDKRASELERKEQTLREYVGDRVGSIEGDLSETVRESVAAGVADARDGGSRLGTVGNLLLGLVGITLVVAGVVNVIGFGLADIPTIFPDGRGANAAVSAILLFAGLAANLTAVADRV